MVEEVDCIQQTEEPGVGRCCCLVHDLVGVVLDGLDEVFHRILLRMVWLHVFGLDAVFLEDVIPCCAGLHLGVVIMEHAGDTVFLNEILEC